MTQRVPLPTNKILRIPDDAYWDWPALQKVLREIRLHQSKTVAEVAAKMGYTRARLVGWEMQSYEPPNRCKKEWANALGYKLLVYSWRQPSYKLVKKTTP